MSLICKIWTVNLVLSSRSSISSVIIPTKETLAQPNYSEDNLLAFRLRVNTSVNLNQKRKLKVVKLKEIGCYNVVHLITSQLPKR